MADDIDDIDELDESDNSLNAPAAAWTALPTAKERTAVQRSVDRLLDELAPERAPARGADRAPVPIERHRTPSGCVLQAPAAAVSVSWFPDTANDASLGELQITVWKGVVTRRGAAPRPEGARVVGELLLRPVEKPSDECVWKGPDGTQFDTVTLVAHCRALLDVQVAATTPATTATPAAGA